MISRVISSVMFCIALQGQPAFEVTSVRPSKGDIKPHVGGGPGTSVPGRWSCSNCNLRALITHAYELFAYQIEAPAWATTESFDVNAKLPPDSKREELKLMVQGLLEDRFKMKAHRESRKMPVYELVIAKGGPKFQQVIVPTPEPPPGPQLDRDGFPIVPGGNGLKWLNGRARLQFRSQTMKNVAHYITTQVDRPVVDATGLTGKYAIKLSWGVKASPSPVGSGIATNTNTSSNPTIFEALEDQLGLKLKPTKDAVEMIVIDHIEKTPIEN